MTIRAIAIAISYILITIMVVWSIGIVTFATYHVFSLSITHVNAAVATCYTALIGIPSVVFGLYQWRMNTAKIKEGGKGDDHSSPLKSPNETSERNR